MVFQIGKAVSKDEAHEFKVHYANDRFVKPEDTQEDTEFVSFFLIPLTGKAQREISDRMMSVSRKGKTAMQTGTAEMIRVLRSVIHVEGMETAQGRGLTRMTEDVYDACPRWMLDPLLAEIHVLNGTDQVEDEDGETTDSDGPFGDS